MIKMKIRIILVALVFVINAVGLTINKQDFVGFTTAQAQSKEDYEENTKSKRKTKKTGAMTERVAKKLQEAQAVIEAEQLAEGIEILNEILEMRRLTDYERAQVNYFFDPFVFLSV